MTNEEKVLLNLDFTRNKWWEKGQFVNSKMLIFSMVLQLIMTSLSTSS
jgi:hypothetical protein